MQLLEQVGVGLFDHAAWLDLGPDPLLELIAHPGDLIEVHRRAKVVVLLRGDQEGGLGQVELGFRRLQQARKRVTCLGRRHASIV